MAIFLTLLSIIAGIIFLLLIAALFIRKKHKAQREIIVNAPVQKVFDFVRLLKNQDQYNKWAKADPNMKVEYNGIDGHVGFTLSWNGNKDAGEGVKEIIGLVENERMESELRFVRPMKIKSNTIITTHPVSTSKTKVTWINSGSLPYPINLFVLLLEKKLPKDMDESLKKLKSILEN